MNKHDAIFKLYPNVIIIRGDEAFDIDNNPVKYDEKKVKALMEANQYKVDRALAYPSIQEQLDTLFHEGYDGWKNSIKAIKDKYPKEAK